MSKIDRKKLQKLILNEMKMLGMADLNPMADMVSHTSGVCPSCGQSECGCDSVEDVGMESSHGHKKTVSREDCCAAVMCLIECCSCPVTRSALEACCSDILSGKHDA